MFLTYSDTSFQELVYLSLPVIACLSGTWRALFKIRERLIISNMVTFLQEINANGISLFPSGVCFMHGCLIFILEISPKTTANYQRQYSFKTYLFSSYCIFNFQLCYFLEIHFFLYFVPGVPEFIDRTDVEQLFQHLWRVYSHGSCLHAFNLSVFIGLRINYQFCYCIKVLSVLARCDLYHLRELSVNESLLNLLWAQSFKCQRKLQIDRDTTT